LPFRRRLIWDVEEAGFWESSYNDLVNRFKNGNRRSSFSQDQSMSQGRGEWLFDIFLFLFSLLRMLTLERPKSFENCERPKFLADVKSRSWLSGPDVRSNWSHTLSSLMALLSFFASPLSLIVRERPEQKGPGHQRRIHRIFLKTTHFFRRFPI
jgi:hypothetical protein